MNPKLSIKSDLPLLLPAAQSRAQPGTPTRLFTWLIHQTNDHNIRPTKWGPVWLHFPEVGE